MKIQLIVIVLASTALALLTTAGSAGAHARLKESTPAVGEVLEASPAEVSITFTNDIQKITGTYDIAVENEAGQSFTAGPPLIDEEDRSVMTVPLQPNLPPGRYVVTYKNVSDADGDPFEAGYAFYVGVEPTQEQLAADALLEPPEVSATQTFQAGAGAGTPPPSAPATEVPSTPSNNTPVAPTNSSDAEDDDSDNLATFVFIGAALAVAAVVGFAIWRAVSVRRTE